MISVSEALSILKRHEIQTEAVTQEINACLGHRLAEDIVAKLTQPPHDASAMDGYAVKSAGVKNGAKLKVIGEVPAGHVFDGELSDGESIRIFTGSPIPKGADHVIIQENVVHESESITILAGDHTSPHIRRAGIDFKQGDLIAKAGQRIEAPEIALAAAANYDRLSVFRKPRIAIIAAGDELVSCGKASGPGDIVNSNTPALNALIRRWGGEFVCSGLEKDDPKAIAAMFKKALHADLIVPIGGASVGDYDHMRRVFSKLGGKMVFEKIAVKPGKPTWFGKIDKTPVLGLPGNPASALVCAHLFLRPLMQGPEPVITKASLTESISSNGPRETYLRGQLSISGGDGRLLATPFPRQDSSLLTPFLQTNILIRRAPLAEAYEIGDIVDVILIDPDRLT